MRAAFSDLRRPPLRSTSLRTALVGNGLPLRRLDVSDVTGSTNADLVSLARTGADEAPDRTLLVTEHQTAGRGRLGRSWLTPARSCLTFSVLLRPETPMHTWSWLSLLAGLAVTNTLRRHAGVEARLKWPNDVLVPVLSPTHRPLVLSELPDDSASPGNPAHFPASGPPQGRPVAPPGKVAGILGEIVPAAEPGSAPAAVLGIGLNVTLSAEELPVPTATSLALAGAATTDRELLLRAIVRELARLDDQWRAHHGDAEASGLAAAARESCDTLGSLVRVQRPAHPDLLGIAEGLDESGRLLVREGDRLVPVAAGDVTTVRPGEPLG
ncbi:MAG: biotin--[acetyl-CoA-carboxylase] ligase [Actinomycetales bacterium]